MRPNVGVVIVSPIVVVAFFLMFMSIAGPLSLAGGALAARIAWGRRLAPPDSGRN